MRLRDPRLAIGVLVAGACLWWTFRDVPLQELLRVLRTSQWWLVFCVAMPCQLLAMVVRAWRWRHLVNPVAPVSRIAVLQATLVGFMVNNVFPLRAGEVVRAWYLAQAASSSTPALLGTVVLERVIDALVFVLLVLGVVGLHGASGGGMQTGQVIFATSLVATILICGVLCLRFAPEFTIRTVLFCLRPLPEKHRLLLAGVLRQLAAGFSSLRGGSHLFWILLHSVVLWLIVAPAPYAAAILAVGLEFNAPQLALAAYTSLAWVGVMIALPNAPGFLGTHQLGCVIALTTFGVAKDLGLAMGWLTWVSFWVPITLSGALVLFFRRTSLAELDSVIEGER